MKKKMTAILAVLVFLLTGCSDTVKDGTELLEKGEYEEAVSTFRQAVEEDKNTAEAYRGLGMAYYELKDYASAQEAFQKVLETDGQETPILYNFLGVCAMQQEDYAAALGHFEKGIALAQESGTTREEAEGFSEVLQEMLFNQIVCYEKQQDWENAKSKMEEYIKIYPDDVAAQKEAQFLETR